MNRFESLMQEKAVRAGVAVFTVVTAAVVTLQLGSGSGAASGTAFIDHALATIAERPAEPENADGWDIANLDHRRVDMWIDIFTTRPKLRERFAVWLERKPKYEGMISEKLATSRAPTSLSTSWK